ncbi:hypothetical protein ACFLY6_01275 [Candidatus Dependentiae bacterium]
MKKNIVFLLLVFTSSAAKTITTKQAQLSMITGSTISLGIDYFCARSSLQATQRKTRSTQDFLLREWECFKEYFGKLNIIISGSFSDASKLPLERQFLLGASASLAFLTLLSSKKVQKYGILALPAAIIIYSFWANKNRGKANRRSLSFKEHFERIWASSIMQKALLSSTAAISLVSGGYWTYCIMEYFRNFNHSNNENKPETNEIACQTDEIKCESENKEKLEKEKLEEELKSLAQEKEKLKQKFESENDKLKEKLDRENKKYKEKFEKKLKSLAHEKEKLEEKIKEHLEVITISEKQVITLSLYIKKKEQEYKTNLMELKNGEDKLLQKNADLLRAIEESKENKEDASDIWLSARKRKTSVDETSRDEKTQIERLKTEIKQHEENYNSLRNELAEVDGMREKYEELKKDVERYKGGWTRANQKIEKLEEELKALSQKYDMAASFKRKQSPRLNNKLERMCKTLTKRDETIETLQERIGELQTELKTNEIIARENRNLYERITLLCKHLESKDREIETLEKSLKIHQNALEKIKDRIPVETFKKFMEAFQEAHPELRLDDDEEDEADEKFPLPDDKLPEDDPKESREDQIDQDKD